MNYFPVFGRNVKSAIVGYAKRTYTTPSATTPPPPPTNPSVTPSFDSSKENDFFFFYTISDGELLLSKRDGGYKVGAPVCVVRDVCGPDVWVSVLEKT